MENHPDADKLYKLAVDIGEREPRTICAGLKQFYSPAEMLDRKVIVVCNLEPRPLRGVISNGMLLAADDEELGGGNVRLLKPSSPNAREGTRMDCGMGAPAGTVDYKRTFSKAVMKVSSYSCGRLARPDMPIDLPDGAAARIVAVIDGGRALPLSDGNGCYATVDDLPLADGAGVRRSPPKTPSPSSGGWSCASAPSRRSPTIRRPGGSTSSGCPSARTGTAPS